MKKFEAQSLKSRADILISIPFLKILTREQINLLANAMYTKKYKAGDVIIKQVKGSSHFISFIMFSSNTPLKKCVVYESIVINRERVPKNYT